MLQRFNKYLYQFCSYIVIFSILFLKNTQKNYATYFYVSIIFFLAGASENILIKYVFFK